MTIINAPDIEPVAVVWAAIFGVLFGIIVLRILLHPLRINGNFVSLVIECIIGAFCIMALVSEMDKTLGTLSFVFVIVSYLSGGAAAILLFPLVLLSVVLTSKQKPESQDPTKPEAEQLTPAPQFSLSELVGMITSLGFSPLAIGAVAHQSSIASTFLMALLAFPMLFWRAVSRLDANKVPFGFPRLGFLFVYPYMVCGCLYFSTCSFLIFRKSMNSSQTWAPEWSVRGLLVCVFVVAAGAVLAWLAKNDSPPPVDPYRPNLFKTR